MKRIGVLLPIGILMIILATGAAAAESGISERGKYIYDEAGRIPLQSELGLNALLWREDVKSGYETVVFLPAKQMAYEDMLAWFNANGVGKSGKDNGIAIFILPDNTVFGMIGKGHDTIAVPFLTTNGGKAIEGIEEEPVLAILNLANAISEKTGEQTQIEKTGSFILEHLFVISLWVLVAALAIFLITLIDGFQATDFKAPLIFVIISIALVGFSAAQAQTAAVTTTEYGMVTATAPDSHWITEWHTYTDAKGNLHSYTDSHHIYTNDVKILSYDFREYSYRFEARDWSWPHDIHEGNYLQLKVNIDNHVLYSADGLRDNSGGQSDGYGTWIVPINMTESA